MRLKLFESMDEARNTQCDDANESSSAGLPDVCKKIKNVDMLGTFMNRYRRGSSTKTVHYLWEKK